MHMTDVAVPLCLSRAPARRRRVFWARIALAGPLAFIVAGMTMAAGAAWLPKGAAGIDHLVLPIVLFPAIWAALFFYTSLDRRLGRAYALLLALSAVNAALIAWQMRSAGAAP
jgi:hypothetical protein